MDEQQQQPPPQQPDPAQLLAYIQQLQHEIQGLNNRVPAVPNPAPPRVEAPKPAKPPTFGGKLNESIDSWIFHIEQYNLVVGMNDNHLIPFAASYLSEFAAIWWRHTYLEQQRLHPGEAWTWEIFKVQLRAHFRPITSEQIGRDRLHSLRQTASVANYIYAFQNIVINIPSMSEEDRLDRFLRGLKPDIHERVAIQQPASLSEACRMANTVDIIRFQSRFQPNRAPHHSKPNGVAPMEIDAIRRNTLTNQEREQLRKSGGCFFCRELGHMIRDCPKKNKRVHAVEILENDESESGKAEAQ
jgi:hypothetical protein